MQPGIKMAVKLTAYTDKTYAYVRIQLTVLSTLAVVKCAACALVCQQSKAAIAVKPATAPRGGHVDCQQTHDSKQSLCSHQGHSRHTML